MTTPSGPARPVHPAPGRHSIPGWRLLASLFGAALVWLAQMSLSEPLAAQACYPHSVPLPAPLWPHLQWLLAGVTLAAVAGGIACAWLAVSSWNRVRADPAEQDAGAGGETGETGDGRTRFLGFMGVMSSALFVAAILITGLAVLIVSPCRIGS